MDITSFFRILWPRPSKEQIINPKDIFDSYYISLKDFQAQDTAAVNAKILELSRDLFEEEEQRRFNIESKATTFLNTLAIIVPLIIGLATLMLNIKKSRALTYIIIGIYILLIIFLIKALLFALRVFGKLTRYYIGPNELLSGNYDVEDIYLKALIRSLVKSTIENYKVNNRQQDYVIIAQACLRNSVFLLSITALLLAAKFIIG